MKNHKKGSQNKAGDAEIISETLNQLDSVFKSDEERYRILAENVSDTVWLMDLNLKVMYISPSVTRLRGYTLEELNAMPLERQMTAESYQRAMALLNKKLSPENTAQTDKKITATIELEFYKKDGSTFWSENNFVLLRDEHGQAVSILSSGRDITERKRAIDALKDSENRYRSLINQAANALFVHDIEGRIVEVNRRACENLGYSQEELLKMNIMEIEQDFDLAGAQREWAKIKPGRHHSLLGHQKRKDGSIFPVEVHFACLDIHGQRYVMGLINDISGRVQAEEIIRYHANLIDQISEAIVSTDMDNRILSWNRGAEKTYDWKAEEVLGKNLFDVVKTTFLDDTNPLMIQAVLAQGVWNGEVIQYNRSNDAIIVNATISLIKDKTGKPSGIVALFRDVTEEKRTEDALRFSEARYKSLFVNMLEGYAYCRMIYENDRPVDFVCLDVNPALEDLTGFTDILGKPISEIIPDLKSTNPELYEICGRVASSGHSEKIDTHLPSLNLWLSISLFSPANGYFVAVFDNITERKEIEERIRQSEERLSLVLRSAEIGTWDWNLVNGDMHLSPQCRTHLGLAFDEVVSYDRFLKVVHPEDRDRVNRDILESIRDVKEFEEEIHIVWPDGSPHWIASRGRVYTDDSGKAIRMAGASIDITERMRNEEIMHINDELFRLTSEMVHVGGWEFNPETLEGTWTDEVARIHGLDPKQPTNVNLGLSFYSGDSRKKIEDAIQNAIQSGIPYDLELDLVTQAGIHKWVRTVGLPVFQGKKIVKVHGIFQDITKRKHAEDEIQRMNAELEETVRSRTAELSDLYNNAPIGYHSVDNDGVYLRVNDTELKWLGYTREELVGKKKIYELFAPNSVHMFYDHFPVMKKQGWVDNLELEMVRKDGSILPVLISASAIYDSEGNFSMTRSTIIDHTAFKASETALRESQAKLESINKELESFSYSVSHDLRAPLRRIDGWSMALLEDYADQLDETAKKYLNRVRAETHQMAALIDDLLLLSKVSLTEMKHDTVNLSVLAETIAQHYHEANPKRQAEFIIQPEMKTQGDPTLLGIVISNLLDNAWKYTGNQSEAKIEFRSTMNDDGPVYFIRDNGAGFDMTYADKLFIVFQRLHTSSEFPGTGVGLATVQRIIHRHGGKIWAEGAVDEGATFYFTLNETN